MLKQRDSEILELKTELENAITEMDKNTQMMEELQTQLNAGMINSKMKN